MERQSLRRTTKADFNQNRAQKMTVNAQNRTTSTTPQRSSNLAFRPLDIHQVIEQHRKRMGHGLLAHF